MLVPYDYLDELLRERARRPSPRFPMSRHASELVELLGLEDFAEAAAAVERARRACRRMGLPEELHFRRVFRYDGRELRPDYQLSALGLSLTVVNCDPGNALVARAQLLMAWRVSGIRA